MKRTNNIIMVAVNIRIMIDIRTTKVGSGQFKGWKDGTCSIVKVTDLSKRQAKQRYLCPLAATLWLLAMQD